MIHLFSTSRRNNKGAAMLIAVIFFLFISLTIVIGIATPILNQVKDSIELVHSKETFYLAEGGIEDAVYRVLYNKTIVTGDTLPINGGTATLTYSSSGATKTLLVSANVGGRIRKMQMNLVSGTGIAFHYGIQSGQGGFLLQNSSSITGNAFSSGPVVGSGNYINGDVISAGSSGLINNIHATGTAYAHTIQNSVIDKDAYYVTKTSTTVGGTSYPGSADQSSAPLPITDAQISAWESDAVAGGTMLSSACDSYSGASNTCTISSTKSLGPLKIPFNLLIKSSSGILTVTGPLWVTGNITTQTGPTIAMSSGLTSQNVAIIADNPSNTTGSGIINVGQSTVFQGSGAVGSYVFMISQNNSAETGGSTDAISMSQGASALVAYASHGQITLSQSVSVKESTAYKIVLTQSANVTYDTGLPSVLFKSGPSGGYGITSWQEVQ